MRTPLGRYRWLCILSGLSLGLQVYQGRQHKVLEDLKDVANKSDKILIFGSGEERGDDVDT